MLSASLLVALMAAFSAGLLNGLTGFGIALIGVPLLLLVYEPATVVALVAVLSVLVNAAVVRDSWREADRRLVLALLPWALLGMTAGTEVLRVVDPAHLRLAVGVLVVVFAGLLLRDVRLPGAGTRWGSVLAGAASGTLSSSTGLSGPPIVLLFASRGFPKRAFRASSALYFLAIGPVIIAELALRGLVDAAALAPLALPLVAAAFVGKGVGTALFGRIPEGGFRLVTLGTVILTGALGVATAAHALLP